MTKCQYRWTRYLPAYTELVCMQLVPIMLTKQSTSATASQNHGLLIFFFIFSPILFLKNQSSISAQVRAAVRARFQPFRSFARVRSRHFGEEDAAGLTILLYVRSVLPVAHGQVPRDTPRQVRSSLCRPGAGPRRQVCCSETASESRSLKPRRQPAAG